MSFRNFSPFPKCHAKTRDGSGVWEGNACCVIAFLRLPTVTLIEKRVADDNRTTSMKLSHPCLFRRMIQNHECWRTWCVYTTWHIIIHCSKSYRVHQGISVYFKFPLYTLRVYALLDRGKMFQEIMLVQWRLKQRSAQEKTNNTCTFTFDCCILYFSLYYITYCHFVHNLIWLSLCGYDL